MAQKIKKMCEFDADILQRYDQHFPAGMFWFILNNLLEGLVSAAEDDVNNSLKGLVRKSGSLAYDNLRDLNSITSNETEDIEENGNPHTTQG